MKTKEFKDLKSKDIKSLVKIVNEKKTALSKKMTEINTGKEKNIKAGVNLRHEIAKILTLIKEKQIIDELEKRKENV